MISISIDGLEPVAKGRPRFTKQGRAYTPKNTAMFEEAIKLSAIAQMRRSGDEMRHGPIIVECRFVFVPPASWPVWKREAAIAGKLRHTSKPDGDNLGKGVCDALNGIAWTDDSQITSLMLKKRYGLEPGVYVTIVDTAGHCARNVKKEDIL